MDHVEINMSDKIFRKSLHASPVFLTYVIHILTGKYHSIFTQWLRKETAYFNTSYFSTSLKSLRLRKLYD